METRPLALIIDDEIQVRRLLSLCLESAGYRVAQAEKGEAGLIEAASRKPDVVLLDLGLPDLDGLEVLTRLREWSSVPVIILSVRDDAADKVAALDAGADDYITKPFHNDELLARLRAAQRHSLQRDNPTFFEQGDLRVDFTERVVTYGRTRVDLTPTEYGVLRLLVSHAGKVLTHAHLLREIWGPKSGEQSQYLRVYVSHLRTKLSEVGAPANLIKTETGIGYRFKIV